MKKDNKTCFCCGKKYKYCNSCSEYAALPQWMNLYDKIECKTIFDVATDYCQKVITKEEAKERLAEYDVTKITLKDSIKKIIDEVYEVKVENIIEEKTDETSEIIESTKKLEEVKDITDVVIATEVKEVEEKNEHEEVIKNVKKNTSTKKFVKKK